MTTLGIFATFITDLCNISHEIKKYLLWPGLRVRACWGWIRFNDARADNESAVRELSDETLKKIAHELTESLRNNLSVEWPARESVRAKLRLMVKRILREYKSHRICRRRLWP